MMHRTLPTLASLAWLATAVPVAAVVARVYPLQQVIDQSTYVAPLKVASVAADGKSAILQASAALKGKAGASRITLRLDSGLAPHVPQLRKRLAAGRQGVWFTGGGRGNSLGIVYIEGTWLQARAKSPEAAQWEFVRLQPEMRPTFAGSAKELATIVKDVVAGKRKAPVPNMKNKPGLGPEVAARGK